MKLLAMIKREAKEVGLVFLYFFCAFGVLLALKKLFLADYRIEVQALSTAFIGALIVAKIVIVLDHTRTGTRFDTRLPLGLASLYKTLFYVFATALVLFLEKLFHAYRESGVLSQAIRDLWEHRDRNIIFAKVICIGLAFLGYHLYAGLDRRLGEGTLRRLVTTPPVIPDSRKANSR
ncbi:MAG: hypothetical protein ACU843_15690 [Gammaproteobacteria bacterium]